MSSDMATRQVSARYPDRDVGKMVAIAKGRSVVVASVFREAVKFYLSHHGRGQAAEDPAIQASMRTRKQIRAMQNELHVVMAFLDMLVRTYLMHTPPLPEEAVDAQAASAEQRYRKLIDQLPLLIQSGEGLAGLSAVLIGTASDNTHPPE